MSYPIVSYPSFPPNQDGPVNRLDLSPATANLPAVDVADTLTAAQLLSWPVVRKNVTLTADCALTLPDADDLVAAISGALVGTSLELNVVTGALSTNGDVVVTAGTGGAVVGTAEVDQNTSARFLVRLTNVSSGTEAYTVTRMK